MKQRPLTKGERIAARRKKVEQMTCLTSTQVAMLKDAASKVDDKCIISMSRRTWAKMGRRSVRTVDRNIADMTAKKVLVCVKRGKGGTPLDTSQYFVPCFLELEQATSAMRSSSVTMTRAPVSPCHSDQCHHDTQTVNTEQTTATGDAAAAVIALLGSDELLKEYKPSSEQLAAIAKVAPTKNKPGGFAATCIRRGITPTVTNTPKAERLRGGLN